MFSLKKYRNVLLWHYENWILYPFYHLTMESKVKRIRNKKVINVLFVITEVGPWKTKKLYDVMLKHKRFNPILGVSISTERPNGKNALIDFLLDKHYQYVDLDNETDKIFARISPDIIFYQKPYDWVYNPSVIFKRHLNSLFCHVHYAFHSTDTVWAFKQPLYKCVWQQYFENKLVISKQRLSMMDDGGKQIQVTGLPIQDQLMLSKEFFVNPWKTQSVAKKKIIYAPHHTIGSQHFKGLALSSFLENGQIMLELMHKYCSLVQWAFKPHPLLYEKLCKIWGQEKTDAYYSEWKNAENSQFEDGAYDALFKYSDAMIHDCSSFTIEYLYTKNPVLFLSRKYGAESTRNEFSQKAYDLHYKGTTKEQIEEFIQNVINGVDPLKEERLKFYNRYLIPPHNKSACENIINAILGEAEYKG